MAKISSEDSRKLYTDSVKSIQCEYGITRVSFSAWEKDATFKSDERDCLDLSRTISEGDNAEILRIGQTVIGLRIQGRDLIDTNERIRRGYLLSIFMAVSGSVLGAAFIYLGNSYAAAGWKKGKRTPID